MSFSFNQWSWWIDISIDLKKSDIYIIYLLFLIIWIFHRTPSKCVGFLESTSIKSRFQHFISNDFNQNGILMLSYFEIFEFSFGTWWELTFSCKYNFVHRYLIKIHVHIFLPLQSFFLPLPIPNIHTYIHTTSFTSNRSDVQPPFPSS